MPLRTFPQTLALIERIDSLIKRRATGSPEQMAHLLGVSRSTWFNYLTVLKEDLHFPIDYDRHTCTYYYSKTGVFKIGYVADELDSPVVTDKQEKIVEEAGRTNSLCDF